MRCRTDRTATLVVILSALALAWPGIGAAQDAGTPPPSVTIAAPVAVRAANVFQTQCTAVGSADGTATFVVERSPEGATAWVTAATAVSTATRGRASARIPVALPRGRWLLRARLEEMAGAVSSQAGIVAAGAKVIALTFDDGPSPKVTDSVLRTLKAQGVRATFFVGGQLARSYPRIVRAELSAGHTVGSHGYLHKPLRGKSRAYIRGQVAAAKAALIRATGVAPRWFRPPYGSTNAQVGSALKAAGMRQVIWTVDPLDWRYRNTPSVTRRAATGKNGGIVLMHDIYATTARAVPGIIASYRSRGFDFVTLDELAALGYKIR